MSSKLYEWKDCWNIFDELIDSLKASNMYRLINIISEVVHVVPYENDFCYTTKQRELFFKDILLLQNIDPASIWNIKDFVFIHDADGNYIYLSQKRIIYSDYGVLTQNKDNNDCLIGYSTSKRISSGVYEKEYVILNDEDFTLSERLLKTTISFCINDNRHLFGTDVVKDGQWDVQQLKSIVDKLKESNINFRKITVNIETF